MESNLTVICSCNNVYVPVILKKLPTQTKILTLKLTNSWDGEEYDKQTLIDLRNLCLFRDLESFRLYSNKNDIYQHFEHILVFADNMCSIFSKLKHLHINVATNYSFTPMAPHLTNLETLDLSFTEKMVFKAIKNMLNFLNTTTLRTLALSNFQTIGLAGFSSELNISSVFNLGIFEQLEELDLSRNTFGVIYPSIIDRLPNLKKLDLSYNCLVVSSNDPLMIEILFHPTLEFLSLSNQGEVLHIDDHDLTGGNTTKKSEENFWQESNSLVSGKRDLVLLALLDCANTIDHGNISMLMNNDDLLFEVIQCVGTLSPHLLKGVSYMVYKSLKEYVDFDCAYFARFPILRNMREIHMDNLNWYTRHTYTYHYKLCLKENSLRNISFTNNDGWIDIFYLAHKGNQTNFSSVFKQAEYVNLSYNNLHFKPDRIHANLKEIDLSGNTVSIDNKSFCQMWPVVTKLILSSIGVVSTHQMLIDGCHSLDLDLSNNMINLTDTNIQIHNICSLKSLKIDRNNIDVLPKHLQISWII